MLIVVLQLAFEVRMMAKVNPPLPPAPKLSRTASRFLFE